ncbi:PA-phosphatase [Fulvivirga sedimenti]|uniref:PA-phosphatase n=1 Tax=Fulvivirga sedimenti TaxID=2879465 RepID=A0A9X1KWJ1_9BACT|nr:PA-phosphatase [Fulvivirga sedimenti]MCA6074014.1 PA-phosphatase [Fulvivirga sedimenti]
MIRKLAEFISVILHPLVQTTLLAAVIFRYIPEILKPFNVETIPNLLFLLAILTFIVPILSVVALRLIGAISTLRMEERRERLMPFFFIGCYYALTVYLFSQRVVLNDVMILILSIITILVFLVFLITFFMKISVHAAASWGVVGFLLAIHLHLPYSPLLYPIVVFLILAGLVSSARLLLNAHTPREVHTGAVLGFALCFGILYFAM